MASLTAVIVDDEQLARELVREYLGGHPGIEVTAECSDGPGAVEAIRRLRPDLVFLDVQMPGLNGFEVLEQLDEIPSVIFSTAYEQFALRAFEVSAVDYLLKPYDRARFNQAVRRALGRDRRAGGTDDRLIALLQELARGQSRARRVFVKLRGKVVPVDTSAIEWIEAQGDYALIHAENGEFLAGQTLARLEALLDPAEFVRIHRSSLVNLNRIQELERTDSGGYVVRLRSGRKLPVSRQRAGLLQRWMV